MSDAKVLALYEPGCYELVPHDTMRRFIAQRLTLPKQTIPHFYLAIDCDIDALLAARDAPERHGAARRPARLQALGQRFHHQGARHGAAERCPRANATWTEEGLLRHRASDIAVAVALEGGGLFTPVIRNAEMKSLSEISNEMRDLAARARSKRLAPHEYQGGTTTISNLGMYGIDRFDAVINPPQASILAVGPRREAPGGQGRCAENRHHDERDALGRSPRDRRRARRRAARRLQGLHRRPGDHAGVGRVMQRAYGPERSQARGRTIPISP